MIDVPHSRLLQNLIRPVRIGDSDTSVSPISSVHDLGWWPGYSGNSVILGWATVCWWVYHNRLPISQLSLPSLGYIGKLSINLSGWGYRRAHSLELGGI